MHFFKDADCVQYLKRTSLCLQLTGAAVSITGAKGEKPLIATNDATQRLPLSVRLSQKAVHRATGAALARVLQNAWRDVDLDIGLATGALFATAANVFLRFDVYCAYPWRLWELCRQFNTHGWLTAIVGFLHTHEAELDVGLSLELQRAAWQQGEEPTAIGFLASDATQDFLELFCRSVEASTLEVERRHSFVKRNLRSRLMHVASASRESILARYHVEWRAARALREKAAAAMMKAQKLNEHSLRWKYVRPAGRQFGSPSHASDTGALDAPISADIGDSQDSAPTPTKADLRAQLADLKHQVVVATAEAQQYGLPASSAEWVQWLTDKEEGWKATLKVATDQRRQHTQRLRGDAAAMPKPLPRIQPEARPQTVESGVLATMHGRHGWHSIFRCATGADRAPRTEHVATVFLASFARRTSYIDMAAFGTKGGIYRLPPHTNLGDGSVLRPLEALAESYGGQLLGAEVFEIDMHGRATSCGSVHLKPGNPRRVQAQTKRQSDFNTCASKLAGCATDCSQSEDSLDRLDGLMEDKDIVSSGCSVGTDVESVMEDLCDDQAEPHKPKGVPEEEHPFIQATHVPEADLATTKAASGTYVAWTDGYFFISDTKQECRIRVYPQWQGKDELGSSRMPMSRTLNPLKFGDARGNPVRTYILLKAWMFTRAEQSGWRNKRLGRARQFDADGCQVVDSIRALGAPDGLLGHDGASAKLRELNPKLAERVAAAGA